MLRVPGQWRRAPADAARQRRVRLLDAHCLICWADNRYRTWRSDWDAMCSTSYVVPPGDPAMCSSPTPGQPNPARTLDQSAQTRCSMQRSPQSAARWMDRTLPHSEPERHAVGPRTHRCAADRHPADCRQSPPTPSSCDLQRQSVGHARSARQFGMKGRIFAKAPRRRRNELLETCRHGSIRNNLTTVASDTSMTIGILRWR